MRKGIACAILVLAVLAAFDRTLSHRRYNVILVTIDTLRADYLSCYNPDASPTPSIDGLARDSVLFRNAFSLIPITLPAHTTILTSHPPEELSLFNNGETYDGKWPLLSEILREHHYHAGAFVSLAVLRAPFGLARYFNTYQDDFAKVGRNYKVASEMNELALPWIEKQRNRTFFAWIHYSDPHEPYVTVDAPVDTQVMINGADAGKYCWRKREITKLRFLAQPGENRVIFAALPNATAPGRETQRYVERSASIVPNNGMELEFGTEWSDFDLPNGIPARSFDSSGMARVINTHSVPVEVALRVSGGVRGQNIKEVRRNYAAEVQYVDQHIGLLLQKLKDLGLERKTIIILTADHGEGLKTHQYMNHINCLYNETVHVPLIIHYPNLGSSGRQVDDRVNHLDIMPTILDLLHYGAPELRGISLKKYVSISPIDRMFSGTPRRTRTYSSTFAPQADFNSFAIIAGNYKMIDTPARGNTPWELYDLIRDPGEFTNLATQSKTGEIRALATELEEYRARVEAAHQERTKPQLNEEQMQILKSLGYTNL